MPVKLLRLFRDYAKKSRGFSALLHCHLFRHTENIVLADLIAKELSSEVFENASNTDSSPIFGKNFPNTAKFIR